MNKSAPTPIYERIFAIVRQIPMGKVACYGQIAKIVGDCDARMVGYALAGLKEGTDVPWQRVVNAAGKVSLPAEGGFIQKIKLVEEGIEFDDKGRIDLEIYGWLTGIT
jgi:methylated-DNA-protein-cysteine methyltransferase related protein